MEKYNYKQAVMDDIRDYILQNDIHVTASNRDEWEEKLNDELFTADSVTGNGSGSYTFNTWKAEEYLCHNMDLLRDAYIEFDKGLLFPDSAEEADVTIRCYLLSGCLSEVLDEMEEDEEEA